MTLTIHDDAWEVFVQDSLSTAALLYAFRPPL
jgi:hypothetical protein